MSGIRAGRLAAAIGFVVGSISFSVAGASPASATFVGIKCATLSGNVTTTARLTGCTGNTGGSTIKIPNPTSYANGGNVTWSNGDSTAGTWEPVEEGTACPSGDAEYVVTGHTTTDNTGSAPVGGKIKVQVCVNPNDNLSLVPGTKAKFG